MLFSPKGEMRPWPVKEAQITPDELDALYGDLALQGAGADGVAMS